MFEVGTPGAGTDGYRHARLQKFSWGGINIRKYIQFEAPTNDNGLEYWRIKLTWRSGWRRRHFSPNPNKGEFSFGTVWTIWTIRWSEVMDKGTNCPGAAQTECGGQGSLGQNSRRNIWPTTKMRLLHSRQRRKRTQREREVLLSCSMDFVKGKLTSGYITGKQGRKSLSAQGEKFSSGRRRWQKVDDSRTHPPHQGDFSFVLD